MHSHHGLVNGVPWEYLKTESFRICTFRNYSINNVKSAIQLANSGFAYIGTGELNNDSVICVFCKLRHHGWRKGDKITAMHQSLSPTCPFVCGSNPSTNIFSSRMIEEINVQITSCDSEGDSNSDAYSDETEDEVSMDEADSGSNIFTDTVTSVSRGNETFTELSHAFATASSASGEVESHASTDTNVTDNSNGHQFTQEAAAVHINPPSSSESGRPTISASMHQEQPVHSSGQSNQITYERLGVHTDRPKKPEFSKKHVREQTFEGWPFSHPLAAVDLVDAGFYYAGYSDTSRCFHCGGGLRNWEDTDNPFVEHARWFPKCGFMKQRMGQEFINAVQNLNKEGQAEISFQDVLNKIQPHQFFQGSSDDIIYNDPSVLAVLDEGLERDDVYEAARALVNENELPLEVDAILHKLTIEGKLPVKMDLSATDQSKLCDLKEHNRDLRKQTTCKVCLEKPITILFLPCQHLSCCIDCAQCFATCPICRKDIKGTVRVLLS